MVRLLECNSKRMIHFKKVSVPPLMLPQWVTGLKKQINLEGAIATLSLHSPVPITNPQPLNCLSGRNFIWWDNQS